MMNDGDDIIILDQFCERLGLDDATKKSLANKDALGLITIEMALETLVLDKLTAAQIRFEKSRETVGEMLARGDVDAVNAGLDEMIRRSIKFRPMLPASVSLAELTV